MARAVMTERQVLYCHGQQLVGGHVMSANQPPMSPQLRRLVEYHQDFVWTRVALCLDYPHLLSRLL